LQLGKKLITLQVALCIIVYLVNKHDLNSFFYRLKIKVGLLIFWFLYILAHERQKVYGFKLIHKKSRITTKGYYEEMYYENIEDLFLNLTVLMHEYKKSIYFVFFYIEGIVIRF